MTTVSVKREFSMPRWPNFLRQADEPDIGSMLNVGELGQVEIELLCADFVEHCRQRGLAMEAEEI